MEMEDCFYTRVTFHMFTFVDLFTDSHFPPQTKNTLITTYLQQAIYPTIIIVHNHTAQPSNPSNPATCLPSSPSDYLVFTGIDVVTLTQKGRQEPGSKKRDLGAKVQDCLAESTEDRLGLEWDGDK